MDNSMNSSELAEIKLLIYTTLQETLDSLGKSIDELKQKPLADYPESDVITIIERTRQFVIFAKYCGDFLKQTSSSTEIREEMVKIKLHLLSVLRSLVESVRAKDKIAAHDLLTEELRDNLTMWKIKVLPMLRPARQSHSGSIHP